MLQDPTNSALSGGTSILGWRTNPTYSLVAPTATLALVSAPSAGAVNVASSEAVVSVNGETDGDVVVTPYIVSAPPGGSGVFTPATATVNSASAIYDTFTFTPDTVGAYSIGMTNDSGLENPAAFGYSSESPYVPPDLSDKWVTDLHPKRPFGASQGTVPAGCLDHAGEANSFNIQSQYASDSTVQTYPAATLVAGVLDADSLTRNAYETVNILVDPDNALRDYYRLRVDKTASGWTASGTNHRRVRAQIAATGTARNTRAWGLDTWFVTAFRIPAAMKSILPQSGSSDWLVFADYHTTPSTDAATTWALEFRGGGPTTPENAQMFIRVHHATTPTAPYSSYDLPLILGGAADEVPADTWIYLMVNFRLWHGYPDPSSAPVATPTGDFYVRPYIAIGSGPVVAKPTHEGLWGIPYPAESVGWARPQYAVVTMYTNPSDFAGDLREAGHLGMQEYLVSDLPPGMTAQDILTAFKTSRELTP